MKHPKNNISYTQEQKWEVEDMASKGIPDKDMAEQTGLSVQVVSQIARNYWKEKMENKQ